MNTHGLFREVRDDFRNLAQAISSFKFWQVIAIMAVGLTMMSVAINGILIPHKFISSGATGIAMTIYYLFGKPSLGVIYWLINIPILAIGYRVMSLTFVVIALIGVVISGTTLELTRHMALPISDPLMAAVIAGTLSGTGVGLYLRFGGTAGGLDIVAAVLRRRFGLPMGQTFFAINALNLLCGACISRSIDVAFYTAIAMFLHSRVVERMQSGFSDRKVAWIISNQPDVVAAQILRTLNRGCTFFHATGGMSQKPLRVIYTVVNMMELARLKEIIYLADPHAFVAISNAYEVLGNRFINWHDKGFEKPRRATAAVHCAHLVGPPAEELSANDAHTE